MAFADATVFRAAVPASQRLEVAAEPIIARIVLSMSNGALMELGLRLIGMTALVALSTAAFGRRGDWRYWFAIGFVALVGYPLLYHGYFASLTPVPLVVARELALHLSANALWGWVYWRHGFLAALLAHCSAHLTLQPLLTVLG